MIRPAIVCIAAFAAAACETPQPRGGAPWAMTSGATSDDQTTSSGSVDAGSGGTNADEDASEGASSGSATVDTSGDDTETGVPDQGSSDDGAGGMLDPPAGGSSGGRGGAAVDGAVATTPSGVDYRLIAPGGAGPHALLVVYSGTEGSAAMTSNLQQVQGFTGTAGFVFAVLDGVAYNGDGAAGADVLDHVRSLYDIDNDRTYLLSESAGTTAGLELGLTLRQAYFAAYWANDVNAGETPVLDADALGFAPWGNAGPGGDFVDAQAIVDGMAAAGYRFDGESPYAGAGAGSHGSVEQFLAALAWFPGKTRQ